MVPLFDAVRSGAKVISAKQQSGSQSAVVIFLKRRVDDAGTLGGFLNNADNPVALGVAEIQGPPVVRGKIDNRIRYHGSPQASEMVATDGSTRDGYGKSARAKGKGFGVGSCAIAPTHQRRTEVLGHRFANTIFPAGP